MNHSAYFYLIRMLPALKTEKTQVRSYQQINNGVFYPVCVNDASSAIKKKNSTRGTDHVFRVIVISSCDKRFKNRVFGGDFGQTLFSETRAKLCHLQSGHDRRIPGPWSKIAEPRRCPGNGFLACLVSPESESFKLSITTTLEAHLSPPPPP